MAPRNSRTKHNNVPIKRAPKAASKQQKAGRKEAHNAPLNVQTRSMRRNGVPAKQEVNTQHASSVSEQPSDSADVEENVSLSLHGTEPGHDRSPVPEESPEESPQDLPEDLPGVNGKLAERMHDDMDTQVHESTAVVDDHAANLKGQQDQLVQQASPQYLEMDPGLARAIALSQRITAAQEHTEADRNRLRALRLAIWRHTRPAHRRGPPSQDQEMTNDSDFRDHLETIRPARGEILSLAMSAYVRLRWQLMDRDSLAVGLNRHLREILQGIEAHTSEGQLPEVDLAEYSEPLAKIEEGIANNIEEVLDKVQSGEFDETMDQLRFTSVEGRASERQAKDEARERYYQAVDQLRAAEHRFEQAFHPYVKHSTEYAGYLAEGDFDYTGGRGVDYNTFVYGLGIDRTRDLEDAQRDYSVAATEARRLRALPLSEQVSRFSDGPASELTSIDPLSGLSAKVRAWQEFVGDDLESQLVEWSEPAASNSDSSSYLTGVSVGHSLFDTWGADARHLWKWMNLRADRWSEMLDCWDDINPGIPRPTEQPMPDELCAGKKRKQGSAPVDTGAAPQEGADRPREMSGADSEESDTEVIAEPLDDRPSSHDTDGDTEMIDLETSHRRLPRWLQKCDLM